jgi:hypothetical protein
MKSYRRILVMEEIGRKRLCLRFDDLDSVGEHTEDDFGQLVVTIRRHQVFSAAWAKLGDHCDRSFVLIQRRLVPTTRFGDTAAGLAEALHPDHRRTGAHFMVFRCLPPGSTALHPSNHPLSHIRREDETMPQAEANELLLSELCRPEPKATPWTAPIS